MEIDRVETARALAKAVAYLRCGRRDVAVKWVRVLVSLLGFDEILIGRSDLNTAETRGKS